MLFGHRRVDRVPCAAARILSDGQLRPLAAHPYRDRGRELAAVIRPMGTGQGRQPSVDLDVANVGRFCRAVPHAGPRHLDRRWLAPVARRPTDQTSNGALAVRSDVSISTRPANNRRNVMVTVKEKTTVTQRIRGNCPTHSRTEISVRDVKAVVDEPKEREGTNMGPTPTETISVAIRIVKGDVLAFEITEIAQPVAEGLPPGRVINDADTRDLPRLLRSRRERPRGCRAAEQPDELASSYVEHGASPRFGPSGPAMTTSRPMAHAVGLLHAQPTTEVGGIPWDGPEMF